MGHVRPNLLILSCILCLSRSLVAAESPLGVIPGEVSFVCRFSSPQRVGDKIDTLMGSSQSQPQRENDGDDDDGTAVIVSDLLIPSLGWISEAATGADQEQDWWAFRSNGIEDPRFGFAIPASDPDALAKDLVEAAKKRRSGKARHNKDQEFATIVHEKWVIHADPKMIDQVRECIAGTRQPMAGLLDQEAKLVFDRGHIGLFVNVPELAKDAGANCQTLAEEYIAASGLTINFPPGVKKLFETIFVQLAVAITQGVRDVDGFAASLTLDDDEIRFENYISVKPDTPTAAFLRANPASTMEPLAALPPSCVLYFGFQGNQKAITSLMTDFIKAGAEGSDPGFSPAHAEIRRGYEELEYGTFAAAFPVWPLERGGLRMLSVTEVNDPPRVRELGLKWMELPDFKSETDDSQKINRTLGEERFGGHPADVSTSRSSFAVNPFPIQGQDFEKLLFGPDGHVTRTVYLKDRIVEATGGTKLEMAAAVRRAADATLDGSKPDDQPLFLKTRRKLGKKANVVVLVNLNSLYAAILHAEMQMGAQMAAVAQPAAGVPEKNEEADGAENDPQGDVLSKGLQQFESLIESLKSSSSLVGFSLTLEPQASRFRVVVPVKTIQGYITSLDALETSENEEADEDSRMGKHEEAVEAAEAQADETPDEKEKPVEVAEEKIVGDRTWKGQVRERKTLNPIAGADVIVKLSTTGDDTTSETKTLREIAIKTGADGTYEFTVKENEAAKRTLYVEFTIRSHEHVEFYGGYGYRLLLKNEKMNERPFFEDLRLARGRAIEGTVKTPEGKPAAGVKVIACTSPNFTNRSAQVRFPDTRTDADGHFHLVIFPQARAILWILPQDYAIQTRPVRQNQEGDLGAFVLNPGPRISGTVLDADGKPVAGVYIEADLAPKAPPQDGKVPLVPEWVADQTHRATVTAEDGSFEFRPLPPGKYTIFPSEKGWDPSTRDGAVDPPRRPLPAVFLESEVTVKRGEKPAPLKIRAIPHVALEIQSMSSKGPKRGGPDLFLFGTRDGANWQTNSDASPQGTYRILAPKGLEDAQLSCITNEHTAVRFRAKKGAPLMADRNISLGKLTRDRTGMQIISYESPILVISAKTEEGESINDLDPKVKYTEREGKNRVGYQNVGVQNQGDGKYRTIQAPPDREMEITIEKAGFKAAQKKISLPEGKVEAVEFVLEKE